VCEIFPAFDAQKVCDRIAQGGLTLFMAVPTIYVRLIDAWEKASAAERERMSRGCRRMRLMVSGSAALPVPTLERWKEISGHVLLERYGMTEIGMCLSNPLQGKRFPGWVGTPLPGVEVRLTDETGAPAEPGTPGEIVVRGKTVLPLTTISPGVPGSAGAPVSSVNLASTPGKGVPTHPGNRFP